MNKNVILATVELILLIVIFLAGFTHGGISEALLVIFCALILQLPALGYVIIGYYIYVSFSVSNIPIYLFLILWSSIPILFLIEMPHKEPEQIPRTDPRSIYYLDPHRFETPQPKAIEYEEKEFVCSRCGDRRFTEKDGKRICVSCGAERYLVKKKEEL